MLELTIDHRRLTEAFLRAPAALTRHMDRQIGRVVREMARSARARAPKAQSELVNAITSDQPSPFEGRVIAGSDHARAVEEGTGTYGPRGVASGKLPPVNAIHDWIRTKRIAPDDPNLSEEDLAWLIARSIAARGTPAQPYMQPALEENRARAERLIEQGIDAALAELGR